MRVLFVLKSALTHNRQNAICVDGIVEKLKIFQPDIEIDYISWEYKRSNNVKNRGFILDGIKRVYPVYYYDSTLINKVYGYVYKLFHLPISSKKLVGLLTEKIIELDKKNNYDAIFAVINPSETAEAVASVKKIYKNSKVVLYEIDPNSNRFCGKLSCFQKYWKYKTTKWELKTYEVYDYIIHMETHKKHYSQMMFSDYFEKSIFLDIPNFIPNKLAKAENGDVVKMLYGGAFYPSLREPYYMVRLLSKLCNIIDIELDIYTGTSMRSELERLNNEYTFISLHKEVSESKLNQIMADSNILISVGNKDSDFLPSKTLMYMGTGKPIIHFYYDDNDVSLKYFRNYPLVLLVDQRKEINAKLIDDILSFLKKAQMSIDVDFDLLTQKLIRNTPEYSAKKFLELIND